jgi:peptide/nickel transport system permease protein
MELLSWGEIAIRSVTQLTPVWVALIITFFVSIRTNDHWVYMVNCLTHRGHDRLCLVMFWVYTGLFQQCLT